MSFHYSNPERCADPNALPDIEVFYARTGELGDDRYCGYYYWACFPGCLPDGDPVGPFETEEEALDDLRYEPSGN